MTVTITAAQVKELRERTNAPMMECKKALNEAAGDMTQAIEILRKTGQAKADKKAGRIAAEGIIVLRTASDGHAAVMLEINSETDFVARDENFLGFANAVSETALTAGIEDVPALLAQAMAGTTVEEARKTLIAKVGENINVRRVARLAGETTMVGSYLHGGRIGVLVALEGEAGEAGESLARDIAMHIAASRPLVVNADDVPADVIEKEKEIFLAQAANSGKPQDIIEKMVAGRIRKFLDEVSLQGQPYVKDPDMTVAALLNKHRAKVAHFVRFEVGEGIEKEVEDFVEAVKAQAAAAAG